MYGENHVVGTGWAVGGGQRGVHRPAEIGRATIHEQRADQHDGCRGQQPEAHIVHARQRHIRRAYHHGYQPVGEPHRDRHDKTKQHDQAVHGGQGVEEIGLNQLQAGYKQFRADAQGQAAADKQVQQCGTKVKRADVLVVSGRGPTHDKCDNALADALMPRCGGHPVSHVSHSSMRSIAQRSFPACLNLSR